MVAAGVALGALHAVTPQPDVANGVVKVAAGLADNSVEVALTVEVMRAEEDLLKLGVGVGSVSLVLFEAKTA